MESGWRVKRSGLKHCFKIEFAKCCFPWIMCSFGMTEDRILKSRSCPLALPDPMPRTWGETKQWTYSLFSRIRSRETFVVWLATLYIRQLVLLMLEQRCLGHGSTEEGAINSWTTCFDYIQNQKKRMPVC